MDPALITAGLATVARIVFLLQESRGRQLSAEELAELRELTKTNVADAVGAIDQKLESLGDAAAPSGG